MVRFAALFLAALFAASASAAPPPPRTIYLQADATIDAQGKVTALEWTTANDAEKYIVGRIGPGVQAWEFAPGTLDGVPAETHTRLWVSLELAMTDEGGIRLRFLDAHTGADVASRVTPTYPANALRHGSEAFVRATLAIDTAGVPTIESVEMQASGQQKSFEASARAALAQWRFKPETVGGRPVAARLVVPVGYCADMGWCRQQRKRDERAAREGEAVQGDDQPVALDSAVKLKTDIRAQEI
jgi:TonB family protein